MVRMFKKWIYSRDASTAVEFSLLAFPFTYLLLGIIELSVMFAAMSTLDASTNDAARLIRTGQAQTSGDPESAFKTLLCDRASVFLECDKIQYEVVHMNSFSDFASYPVSYDEDGNLLSQGFDAGSVDDVILIRTVYQYPLLTPLLGAVFGDGANKKRMVTTIVLETEPYDVEQVVDQL